MTKSKKKGWKKWLGYLTNVLLVLIIAILLVPSWRKSFQIWFSQMTLSEVEFEAVSPLAMPNDQKNWALTDSDYELLNFAELEGKPIVLNFWATWCPSCKASFPDFGDLRGRFGDEIAFLAVTNESMETVNLSGESEKYDFLYSTQSFPDFFDIKVYPTVVVMDGNMNLVSRMEGAADLDNEENVDFLRGLLQNP